jgi:lysophospholipase L1-like esterase
MLGASSIERGEWTELLGRADVVNRGVAGEGALDVLARVDRVLALSPRVVVVHVGANDLLAGAAPADVAATLDAIAARLRAGAAPPRVVLVAVFPLRGGRDHVDPGAVGALNRALAEVAGRRGCDFLDPGLAPADLADGVHPGASGYLRWAAALRPLLR